MAIFRESHKLPILIHRKKNGQYFWNCGNLHPNTGWWFGTFYFSIIYGIILPIDFHIFQDG